MLCEQLGAVSIYGQGNKTKLEYIRMSKLGSAGGCEVQFAFDAPN